ncbi:C40 family peptidase [Flammeovirgaceae bacterium SG7u.111]|nr:C40 family peptidase [Flammeovirgaceae bacterium SG7u.132]WPO35695.1 C40 family peptidase [Flammeovirgaceae bacterium SG7u.111]
MDKRIIKAVLVVVGLFAFYKVVPRNSALDSPQIIGKVNPIVELEHKVFESVDAEEKREKIVTYSQFFLGVPYKYAATDPKVGFDCSGFVYYVFKHFNVSVPRSSSVFQTFGEEVSIEDAQKADIIVFTGTDHTKQKAGHVGIVIGNEDGKLTFIHASSSKKRNGVVTNVLQEGLRYQQRFMSIRRVIK